MLTLTRLGVGKFTIADLDVFDLANFNRQAGASLSHVGRTKVEVLREGKTMLRRMARLLFDNAGIRLATPDAYEVQNFRQVTESLAWLPV